MNDNICPICGDALLPALAKLHIQLESTFIREMQAERAELRGEEGRQICIAEYKNRHEQTKKEARELRVKTGAYEGKFSDTLEGEPEEDTF